MKKINEFFFASKGEKGLTATSANYLANIATEECEKIAKELAGVSFINTDMAIVGSSERNLAHRGFDETDLKHIPKDIDMIANLTCFISYIREAIKAKDDESREAEKLTFDAYLELRGIELPPIPKEPIMPDKPEAPTQLDVVADMTPSERLQYLSNEAIAATYGKYIHSDGLINQARDEMHVLLSNPVIASGSGRDTIIRYHSYSAPTALVDEIFMNLQNAYRTSEKALNGLKYSIKEELKTRQIAVENDYRKLIDQYHIDYDKYATECNARNIVIEGIRSEYAAYRTSLINEVSKLKIRIPKSLESTFHHLDSLGKEEEK